MASRKKPVKRKPAKRKAVKRPSKKKAVRKPVKKALKKRVAVKAKPAKKKVSKKKIPLGLIGIVTHYFPHVQAAVVKLKAPLATGDVIKIKGHTTDLTQAVSSMQIDHVSLDRAKPQDEIGLLVSSRVRRGDQVLKA